MAVEKNKYENESSIRRFYRTVLTWDYLRILDDSKKKGKGSSVGLKKVKETYKDVDDYLATFEPLLFEEVKAQIAQGRSDEENAGEFNAVIAKCIETDGFHLVTVTTEATQLLSQNDLIIISKTKLVEGKELPTKYAFALVEHCSTIDNEMPKIELRMNLKGEVKCQKGKGFEPSARLLNMCTIVSEVNSSSQAVRVFILKICSLSTIAREYVALRSISSLPFKDLVLAAKEINYISEDQKWVLPKTLMESLENNHNESQMDSIRAGLSRKRFVLIQGPPGTGKTQTILGLLSAVLHATPARVSSKDKTLGIKRGPELPIEEKYNHWQKAAPWLRGINPRDAIMPVGGDDGVFPTTGNDMRPEVISSSRKHRVRVLVCAPSNSALDEIVLRLLKTGIRDENDRVYNPKIVRIGLKPHHSVQAVSMEHLITQKRAAMDFKGNNKNKQGGGGSENDSLRASILEEAAIVFSTLSFSGSPLFSKLNRGFDVVIIDEAAQAVEAATLIPLANGCKQVFLVGDPVQLPATVISTVAEKFGYGMSLFKRFQKAGYQVVMLKTQYRMHPEIRSFPSGEFYGGELEDGIDVEDQTRRAWHDYKCFGPFCFFDIHDGKESQPTGNTGSFVNEDEVDFVFAMYHKLVSKYPELKESSRLAIISPYQQQVKLFRDRFQSSFGVESKKLVDIGTIDGFQGREKDVAIFSCVRANETKSIGFVSDFRRMNVGITRARSSVLVVGSVSTLEKDKHWKSLIDSARARGCLYKVSKPYKNFFSDESIKSMLTVPEEPMDDTMGMEEAIFGNAEDAEQVPGDDDFGGDGGDDVGMDED